jgi:hypothetical protein
MKLLGKNLPTDLLERIDERLRARGLLKEPPPEPIRMDGVEPRVDPLSFNLSALEENVDATRALPLHSHRAGVGRAVVLAKWVFRKSCQVLINETLGRQRVFNGHVRDSYAQLAAEVIRLRRDVRALREAAEEPESKAPDEKRQPRRPRTKPKKPKRPGG